MLSYMCYIWVYKHCSFVGLLPVTMHRDLQIFLQQFDSVYSFRTMQRGEFIETVSFVGACIVLLDRRWFEANISLPSVIDWRKKPVFSSKCNWCVDLIYTFCFSIGSCVMSGLWFQFSNFIEVFAAQAVLSNGFFTPDQKQTDHNSSDHQIVIDLEAVAGLKFANFTTSHPNKCGMLEFHRIENFHDLNACNLYSCYCRFNTVLLWCQNHILLPEKHFYGFPPLQESACQSICFHVALFCIF